MDGNIFMVSGAVVIYLSQKIAIAFRSIFRVCVVDTRVCDEHCRLGLGSMATQYVACAPLAHDLCNASHPERIDAASVGKQIWASRLRGSFAQSQSRSQPSGPGV